MSQTKTAKVVVRLLGRYLPLTLLLVACFARVAYGAAAPKTVIVTGELVTVKVDEDSCDGQPSYCVDTASTTGASSTNSSAFQIVVQLIGPFGNPITGLTSSDFTLRGASTPVDIQFASCGTCFQEIGDGLYTMVVETINNFNWVEGTYFYQMQVDVGPGTAYSLFSFEIPQ